MILIPVCRTFIRFLYNISTSGHHWYSRILAWVFTWIPLDKALQWHKVMAAFIYASAWLHTWAHMQNYAVHYDTYESIWGSHIWVPWLSLTKFVLKQFSKKKYFAKSQGIYLPSG